MEPTEKGMEGTRQGGPQKPAKNEKDLHQVLNGEEASWGWVQGIGT